ncbi:MAG TPA: isochorismatase family protein [Acidimicrobiales bacterium]|nr:isochorismatase family protein [Acidimicrobiales bacterium]
MDEIAAGFGGSLGYGRRAALILIDMMHGYFDEGSPFQLPSSDCLASASRVLDAARASATMVIHTKVVLGPAAVDAGVFVRKIPALRAYIGESRTNELMAEVAPLASELVIVKQYASAFLGTTLAATLQASGVDTLIITGVSTSGCVRATGVDAVQHGFIPKVVRDAVGDRGPGPHEANLYDLQAKYADVVSEREILDYLASLD